MSDTQATMALSDTSPEARLVDFRRLAEMTPGERVQIGVGLWEAGHALQQAALRRKFPEADDDEIALQIVVTRFGPELARAAWRRL